MLHKTPSTLKNKEDVNIIQHPVLPEFQLYFQLIITNKKKDISNSILRVFHYSMLILLHILIC